MPIFGADQGVAVIQALTWMLWALVPVVVITTGLTPYLMPKRECFAVAAPRHRPARPLPQGLEKAVSCLGAGGNGPAFGCAGGCAGVGRGAGVHCASHRGTAGHQLGRLRRSCCVSARQVQRLQKGPGLAWPRRRRSAGFAGPEPFPKPSLPCNGRWLYVPLILITFWRMGIVGYPAMPGKVPAAHRDLAGQGDRLRRQVASGLGAVSRAVRACSSP